jgi:hypothetical protein
MQAWKTMSCGALKSISNSETHRLRASADAITSVLTV